MMKTLQGIESDYRDRMFGKKKQNRDVALGFLGAYIDQTYPQSELSGSRLPEYQMRGYFGCFTPEAIWPQY